MAHDHRPAPAPAAGPARRLARRATAQALADALENPRDDLDRLIGDLRLATRCEAGDFDRFEERMQMITAAMMQPFRGARPPSAPALSVERDGDKARAWY